jgi:DNA-binding NarL/FixJ family response regulator
VLAGHCVELGAEGVSNILGKLGVDSRIEAAAVAHRLGVTG